LDDNTFDHCTTILQYLTMNIETWSQEQNHMFDTDSGEYYMGEEVSSSEEDEREEDVERNGRKEGMKNLGFESHLTLLDAS